MTIIYNHLHIRIHIYVLFSPDHDDEEGWFSFILSNFERHYSNNRAPFGFYVHEWYIAVNPALRAAFIRFLDTINHLNDVFMVNMNF